MIGQLTIDEVVTLLKTTPEQAIFDWKTDFSIPDDDEKRGELLKDISAIANATTTSYGFILYGVDPRKSDPIIGTTKTYDDSRLQQFVRGKIEPPVEFLYYEVSAGPRIVAVIQIQPTRSRPHVIRVDMGKVRKGQIAIRRGSSTDGVTINDLLEFFYGANSGYYQAVLQRLQVAVSKQRADIDFIRELRLQENELIKQMEITTGLPPGSLGGKW